jgi:hypothetical protein
MKLPRRLCGWSLLVFESSLQNYCKSCNACHRDDDGQAEDDRRSLKPPTRFVNINVSNREKSSRPLRYPRTNNQANYFDEVEHCNSKQELLIDLDPAMACDLLTQAVFDGINWSRIFDTHRPVGCLRCESRKGTVGTRWTVIPFILRLTHPLKTRSILSPRNASILIHRVWLIRIGCNEDHATSINHVVCSVYFYTC